jgi:dihydrofolate synthase/folylpolyglutamate synthase
MNALAELVGHPERYAPVIHVAGSKGKGSVTGIIASILEADGRKAARYMSPHIADFRERISLGNRFFEESVYCAAGDELRDLADVKVPASNHKAFDPAYDGEPPTFYELLTMYFFLCARTANCDAMVVETGLGGRLDSTNIVDPVVSIINLIELEHTAYLGDTLALVAGEKAGIIKNGRPLVLARQNPEALEVFKKRAAEKNSPFLYFPDCVMLDNLNVHKGGTDFSLAFRGEKNLGVEPLHLSLPIPGTVQAENAGLAVLALKVAFPDIGNDAICRGLKQVKIPARFEKVADDPVFIIDGAHTPESASLCVETFCSLYGEGGLLLFGCAVDKNVDGMAEVLVSHFSHIIITMPGNFKVSDTEHVYDVFSHRSGGSKTKYVKDTEAAVQLAWETAKKNNVPIICMGSFYLAAKARNYLM